MSRKKDAFRSPNWASVLDDDEVIVITVMGDGGVGKTSLVRVFTSEIFTEEDTAGSVVEPAILQRSDDRLYGLHIRDTPSFLSSSVDRLYQELELTHVVILCYAVDQPSSLKNLETYWLPHIASFKRRLPVLVVATKADLSAIPSDGDEAAAVEAILAETDSLLTKFPNVERVMRCSAKFALEEVKAVFNQASHMVMYPVAPLLDEATETLTPQCDVALTRIFRVFDQRNRGVLGTAELGAFQEKTFGLLLASHEMNSILEVIRSETRDAADRDAGNPDAENPVAVIVERDGSMSLTEIGFKRVITMFIQQNIPESAWSVLKSFHYNKHLQLQIPEFPIPSGKRDQSPVLTPDAEGFVEGLFDLFAKTDQALNADHLQDMFRVVPEAKLPFGPRFPYNARCKPSGELYRDSWLQLWSMLAMTDPAATMRTLYCLGFGLKYDLDATKALALGPCRKSDPFAVSKQRRCFVLGSAGVGKSTLIHTFLNRNVKLELPPTTEPIHYVKRPPQSTKAELEAAKISSDEVQRRPNLLVITEFPSDMSSYAIEQAEHECDVCLIAVDPSTDDSIAFATTLLEHIPDNVPTVIVSCPHATAPTGDEKLRALSEALEIECMEFSPRSADGRATDIFQYAAMVSPDPWIDNPKTLARKVRIATAKRNQKLKVVGTVVLAGLVVGGLLYLGLRNKAALRKPDTNAAATS